MRHCVTPITRNTASRYIDAGFKISFHLSDETISAANHRRAILAAGSQYICKKQTEAMSVKGLSRTFDYEQHPPAGCSTVCFTIYPHLCTPIEIQLPARQVRREQARPLPGFGLFSRRTSAMLASAEIKSQGELDVWSTASFICSRCWAGCGVRRSHSSSVCIILCSQHPFD